MKSENWKNNNLFKALLLIIIAWVILAIIFGFTDLEISKAFVDREALWGIIGKDYGEPPGHVLWVCCLVVLIGTIIGKDDIKKQKIFSYVLIILTILAFVVGLIIGQEDLMIYGAFISVGLTLFTLITRDQDWNNYKKFAIIVILLVIINPLIFVQVIKTFAGRVRFNSLTPPDYLEYTPWFIFNGITGHKSFPSGHTAMGWMLLPLLILVRDKEWNDPVKILTWIGVMGWGFFVGLSRIVQGAHYASDVLFSTAFAFIIMIVLYWKFYSNE